MNNKLLAIIFFTLLVIYLATRLFSGQTERTFTSELVQLDTAAVSRIELYPKADPAQPIVLMRQADGWMVQRGEVSARAVPNIVQSVLGQLALIKAKRVVAKQPDRWADYEVEEGNGTRVRALVGEQPVADFRVGRFNFDPQTRQATSYVRLGEQEEVYAVDGFLAMTFGQDFSAYRNKQLVKLAPTDTLSRVALQTSGGQQFQWQRVDGRWLQADGTPVDSASMASYIESLRFISGSTFADGFTPGGAPDLSLQLAAAGTPITIQAYRSSAGEKPFVIHSSQFPEAYFSSDSAGVYARLFNPLLELAAE